MRSAHFNFAVAIVISTVLHLLLYPVATHFKVRVETLRLARPTTEVTLLLTDPRDARQEKPKPIPPEPAPKKKPIAVDPPDQMGEATGKGTGAQAAKGDQPMQAREADQDQAPLSRDPVGRVRLADPPTFDNGPRGEDGSGGQIGGIAAANPAHAPSANAVPRDSAQSDQSAEKSAPVPAIPPRQSVVRATTPPDPSVMPPSQIAPPPAQSAKIGAAAADLNRPAIDAVKARASLTEVASALEGPLVVAPVNGQGPLPVPASSTAPPIAPNASIDRAAVTVAPELPIPKAAVSAPQPPAVDPAQPKPTDLPKSLAEKPAVVSPPAAAAIVTTGNARAPGRDRATADPAQPSDSDSDPFSKTLVADILHDGRLEVQRGRKVKTTRPHFLPGFFGAVIASPDPTVVLKISIDEKGNVIPPVEVVRSSGSEELDQPCRVAVYDWWFEPAHDKAGKPVPDVVVFTIHFR